MKGRRLKSIAHGWASIFDISGTAELPMPDYANGTARDAQAIRGDWVTVGNDLRRGMELVAQE